MAYRAATFVISVHRMKVGCAKEKDMEKFKACGERYKATIQERQNGEVTDEITGVREIPEHSVPHPKKIQNTIYQLQYTIKVCFNENNCNKPPFPEEGGGEGSDGGGGAHKNRVEIMTSKTDLEIISVWLFLFLF